MSRSETVYCYLFKGTRREVSPSRYVQLNFDAFGRNKHAVRTYSAYNFKTGRQSICLFRRELYKLILVDTPLAPYFDDCMTLDIDESNLEILRNTLHKVRTSKPHY